jgi:hypothetical protein
MEMSPLFSRHPLVFRRLANLPVGLSLVSRSPFGPLRFSYVSWRSYFSFPAAIVFCLPPVGAVTVEVAWLPTAPARRLSLMPGRGDRLPPNVLALVFWAWLLEAQPAVRASA